MGHCIGETVVDVWNYKGCGESTWGRDGKNCFVVQELNVSTQTCVSSTLVLTGFMQVSAFFDLFLDCVDKCDKVSPLNRAAKGAP